MCGKLQWRSFTVTLPVALEKFVCSRKKMHCGQQLRLAMGKGLGARNPDLKHARKASSAPSIYINVNAGRPCPAAAVDVGGARAP